MYYFDVFFMVCCWLLVKWWRRWRGYVALWTNVVVDVVMLDVNKLTAVVILPYMAPFMAGVTVYSFYASVDMDVTYCAWVFWPWI